MYVGSKTVNKSDLVMYVGVGINNLMPMLHYRWYVLWLEVCLAVEPPSSMPHTF